MTASEDIALICKYIKFMIKQKDLIECNTCEEFCNKSESHKTTCCQRLVCYDCLVSSESDKCLNKYCKTDICKYCGKNGFCKQQCEYGM